MNENELTQEEIIDLLLNKNLVIEKVIDAIIDINGIIGVGLITLAQSIYLYIILNPQLRKEGITKEEADKIVLDYKNKHFSNIQN